MARCETGIADVTDWLLYTQMKADRREKEAERIISRMESLISSIGSKDFCGKRNAQIDYAIDTRNEVADLKKNISEIIR